MRKLTRITIRLEEPLLKALQSRAEREDETVNEIARQAIRAWVGPVRKPTRSED